MKAAMRMLSVVVISLLLVAGTRHSFCCPEASAATRQPSESPAFAAMTEQSCGVL